MPIRSRTPFVLTATLLLAIIAILSFTIRLLQAQRSILEEALRNSQTEAMSLLAHRIERAILGVTREPFRIFTNIPQTSDNLARRLSWMRERFPEVKHVMFLDSRMQRIASYPPPTTETQETLENWLIEQIRTLSLEETVSPGNLSTLVTSVPGASIFFAWQPVDDADAQQGWVILGFDLERVRRHWIAPLLADFNQKQAGEMVLREEETGGRTDALHWPMDPVLPGWELVFASDPKPAESRLWRERLLILSVGIALVLAMIMATFWVWREIRRERVLLELRNRFVANVSHELRSPLALIRMYAETLHLGRVTDEARRQQYYQTILRQAERLTWMIDNVLDFARLRKGIQLYPLTETNLRQTVDQVLADHCPRIRAEGIQFQVHMPPQLPPVRHNQQGITQILLNLIDNAIKHGKHGASGGLIELRLDTLGDKVMLEISDRGPGIPAHERERVRKPFYQGGKIMHVDGAGLGLALVEEIAEAHHAHFALSSVANGYGTRAVVSFPSIGAHDE